jgi:hypothetical protein
MTDRTAELESAIRAQDALIAGAQKLLTDYFSKEIDRRLSTACSNSLTDRSSARLNGLRVKP